MKIIKSFKIIHHNDEFPTMYTHIDNNKFYMSYTTNNEFFSVEISYIEYITALINYLPTHIKNQT